MTLPKITLAAEVGNPFHHIFYIALRMGKCKYVIDEIKFQTLWQLGSGHQTGQLLQLLITSVDEVDYYNSTKQSVLSAAGHILIMYSTLSDTKLKLSPAKLFSCHCITIITEKYFPIFTQHQIIMTRGQ